VKKDKRHTDHPEPEEAVDEKLQPASEQSQETAPEPVQERAGEQDRPQTQAKNADEGGKLPARRESHRSADSEKQLSPELELMEKMRAVATSPQLQAFWKALLPHLGVLPSQSGEFPGMFRVESEPGETEATVYIDIPNRPYERGVPSELDRVLALKISLDHDFRRLGNRHYCVDCEVPGSETRH
jgi:hypothetical protein